MLKSQNKLSAKSSGSYIDLIMSRGMKKVIYAIAILMLVRWVWLYMRAPKSSREETLAMNYAAVGKDQKPFPGSSCVMKNGICVPEKDTSFHIPTKGLYAYGDSFYLDGRPFRILSGSFHYFRTQPAQWGDRLLKMKAAGLNTITTYVAWNIHEKVRGDFQFSGRYDVASFIRHVHEVGLKLIVRPGPYICSEWDWGGLPSWLLHDPNMVIRRSTYKPYIDHVEAYFSKLIPLLATYQYKKGAGPIIAFQIENEHGSYTKDTAHMESLKKMYLKYGVNELLFTSDGTVQQKLGSIPGVLSTINFQKDVKKSLDALHSFQPNMPMMVTEYWSGWFDHWGEKHHTIKPTEFIGKVREILERGASINFYMFTGGTNFEFFNGANNGSKEGYGATITSYDYDAPISECGDVTVKFIMLRKLFQDLKLVSMELPEIPGNTSKAAYGVVKFSEYLTYNDMIPLIKTNFAHSDPLPMEFLDINNGGGQGYGWILYRTQVKEAASKLTVNGKLEDRALLIRSGKLVNTVEWKVKPEDISIQGTGEKLDIFVENAGRVNYKDVLDHQRKGIVGKVFIDGSQVTSFEHVPFEFDDTFLNKLRKHTSWNTPYKAWTIPCAYRGSFMINGEPKDTFLDMVDWVKGIVIINGYNIGRYWDIGPQRTLFVPAPLLLTGKNEVIIFELHGSQTQAEFVSKPILAAN